MVDDQAKKLRALAIRLPNFSHLESTRLIARGVTRSKAIAVKYSLTELGRTISLHSEAVSLG